MGFFGDLFNSEEKQEKKAKLSRIKLLLMLSNVDGEISAVERGFIFAAADILGFNNQDVLKVTKELMNGDGGVYIPKDSDKAFDLLRDLVKLMLIDGEMHPNEIHFCKKVAVDCGFNPEVIDELAKLYLSDDDFKQKIKRLSEIYKDE